LGIQNKGSCEEVRWLGWPLCSCPSAAAGLVPSIGFFGFQRERERERGATKEGKKNLLLPAFARLEEEDDVRSCKNNTLLLFFL
jgi:hypothetical protein